jgi:hypothetical protein
MAGSSLKSRAALGVFAEQNWRELSMTCHKAAVVGKVNDRLNRLSPPASLTSPLIIDPLSSVYEYFGHMVYRLNYFVADPELLAYAKSGASYLKILHAIRKLAFFGFLLSYRWLRSLAGLNV